MKSEFSSVASVDATGSLPSMPQWLAEASLGYSKVTGNSDTETSFFRGNPTMKMLERVLPDTPKPNILLVGLGLDAEPITCCYEPFRIAAHLEGKKVDYTMTLVDVDPDVVADILAREKLFLCYKDFNQELQVAFKRDWDKYLADTGQVDREVYEEEPGMDFPSYMKSEHCMVPYTVYLKQGISVANVSSQFREKLTNGEIVVVHDDVAVADISKNRPYDYVELTNVLYLMSHQGQKLALANIVRSLAPGGRILINDLAYTGKAMAARFGGWLDEEKLADLGLRIEEVISSKERSEELLLQKTS